MLGRRVFAACLFAPLCAAAAAPQDPPQVIAAWARATAPGQTTGAVYFTMTSRSPDRLVSVSSPGAASAQLHRSTVAGATAGMEAVDGLDVSPGKPVTLAPHGLHVMLMDLKQPLVAGAYVTLALTFSRSGTVSYNVPIVPIGATGPGRAHE